MVSEPKTIQLLITIDITSNTQATKKKVEFKKLYTYGKGFRCHLTIPHNCLNLKK